MADATIPTTRDHNQEPLRLTRPKVVSIDRHADDAITKPMRRLLLQSCPHPYRVTLGAVIGQGQSSGVCFARLETLAASAGVNRRTVYRHRAWLVEAGYLALLGGGYRKTIARYLIRTPDQRATWLAERDLDAARAVAPPPPNPAGQLGDRLAQLQQRFGL